MMMSEDPKPWFMNVKKGLESLISSGVSHPKLHKVRIKEERTIMRHYKVGLGSVVEFTDIVEFSRAKFFFIEPTVVFTKTTILAVNGISPTNIEDVTAHFTGDSTWDLPNAVMSDEMRW